MLELTEEKVLEVVRHGFSQHYPWAKITDLKKLDPQYTTISKGIE
jgi:hypothetical protein